MIDDASINKLMVNQVTDLKESTYVTYTNVGHYFYFCVSKMLSRLHSYSLDKVKLQVSCANHIVTKPNPSCTIKTFELGAAPVFRYSLYVN